MSAIPQIPGYDLKSLLGAGGMGVVYFAIRHDNDQKYAIKMLLGGREAAISELARFRIEAEAYACLNHPYIVKIRDVGVVSGCPFLAMDYVENGSLSDYIEKSPSLDLLWRIRTIKNVAEALSHAHSRRILHRDLKPANILIASDGSPRVSDFGLVKFSSPLNDVSQSYATFDVSRSELDEYLLRMTNENRHLLPVEDGDDPVESLATRCAARSSLTTEWFHMEAVQSFIKHAVETRDVSGEAYPALDDMTRYGSVMGSPQFMSPEQAEGRVDQLGPQTDVYGLGATLYSIVTGKPPVSGSSLPEILRNVSLQQIVPPNEIVSSVSDDLNFVIMKAIEKDATRRYATMEMFSEDLGRLLDYREPLARLHRRATQTQKKQNSFLQRITLSLSSLLPKQKHPADDRYANRTYNEAESYDVPGSAHNSIDDSASPLK